jgi:hypothetical protein
MTSILQPLAGASSLPSLASTPDPDSFDDYPEVRDSACGEPIEGGKAVALSAWWPRMVIGRTTVLADIPPSGDQRHLMLGR